MEDYINITFRDGSAQVDYSIASRNNILLAITVLEAMASKECDLHIDDIRAIIDEEKRKLEVRPTKVIES